MQRGHDAGMKIGTAMRLPAWLPMLGLVAIVSGGFGMAAPLPISGGGKPAGNALVHWRKGGHDWLVVANGKADEVVVYDAVDGRPLQRLPIAQGLQDSHALIERDGRLFVVGTDGEANELRLPPLQVAAVDRR